MIIIDLRRYGKELTLDKCVQLYDQIHTRQIDLATHASEPIETYPDQFWINQWQQDNIFGSHTSGVWKEFRGIPLKVLWEITDDPEPTNR